MYYVAWLPKDRQYDRGRGPARYVIEADGMPLKEQGILFLNTAKEVCSTYLDKYDCVIREMTETELMSLILKGWRVLG